MMTEATTTIISARLQMGIITIHQDSSEHGNQAIQDEKNISNI